MKKEKEEIIFAFKEELWRQISSAWQEQLIALCKEK